MWTFLEYAAVFVVTFVVTTVCCNWLVPWPKPAKERKFRSF
jgi:hypothetical protein